MTHTGAMEQKFGDAKKRAAPWSHDTPHLWVNDYPNCDDTRQSPINLLTATATECADFDSSEIELHEGGKAELENVGHTIEIKFEEAGETEGGPFGEDDYKLLQFHFHAPSEHKVNGRSFPLEMHFVHKNSAGKLAVLGVLFDVGDANDELDFLLKAPKTDDAPDVPLKEVRNLRILKDHRVGSFYTWSGSLTTPPCTEGVTWMLSTNVATISTEQIEAFTALYPLTARPTQPTNGRSICFVKNSSSSSSSTSSSSSSSSSSSK